MTTQEYKVLLANAAEPDAKAIREIEGEIAVLQESLVHLETKERSEVRAKIKQKKRFIMLFELIFPLYSLSSCILSNNLCIKIKRLFKLKTLEKDLDLQISSSEVFDYLSSRDMDESIRLIKTASCYDKPGLISLLEPFELGDKGTFISILNSLYPTKFAAFCALIGRENEIIQPFGDGGDVLAEEEVEAVVEEQQDIYSYDEIIPEEWKSHYVEFVSNLGVPEFSFDKWYVSYFLYVLLVFSNDLSRIEKEAMERVFQNEKYISNYKFFLSYALRKGKIDLAKQVEQYPIYWQEALDEYKKHQVKTSQESAHKSSGRPVGTWLMNESTDLIKKMEDVIIGKIWSEYKDSIYIGKDDIEKLYVFASILFYSLHSFGIAKQYTDSGAKSSFIRTVKNALKVQIARSSLDKYIEMMEQYDDYLELKRNQNFNARILQYNDNQRVLIPRQKGHIFDDIDFSAYNQKDKVRCNLLLENMITIKRAIALVNSIIRGYSL